MRGHKLLCLTGFSDDQSEPVVLVFFFFLIELDSGSRNCREIINMGDHS